MSIEEAIQQKRPFSNVHHRALVNLMFSNSWLISKQREFFKQFGLTERQFNVLRILKGAKRPLSTALIRERLLYKMSDVSRVIDRMEKKNWVLKQPCTSDRRLVDISLTKEGEKLLAKVNEREDEIGAMLNNLSEEEAIQLNDLLDKMRG